MSNALTEEQKLQLASVDQEASRSLVALGSAHLRLIQAKAIYEEAQMQLTRCEHKAQKAEQAKAQVMDQIAQELQLPDGNYVYDPEAAAFQKKEL